VWLVRHGESTGNVAREVAESGGAELIDLAERDADVPLSDHGRRQAAALGRWFAELPAAERPTQALSSPYRRAHDTAVEALAGLPSVPLRVDERVRDRELGILDLLTTAGVMARYPDEAARRRRLGKLYHRPPGGESWADVALRLRAVLAELNVDCPGGRVVLFTHEAPIFLARYVIEGLSEVELLDIARATTLANCSLTRYERAADGALHLEEFNATSMLERDGAQPTKEPGVRAEPV